MTHLWDVDPKQWGDTFNAVAGNKMFLVGATLLGLWIIAWTIRGVAQARAKKED